ncbi:hypothetical protein PV328_003421 [Microctonus aethiopoides]|uniref:Peptidase M12B domain-containing protein n=1 Tax=Microctonus aethiopoides TaxID=144406 RepID=A0AA39F8M1_9HYME|nr:hypothetical protein PV328_003421 [Microctonus aethiopoides]
MIKIYNFILFCGFVILTSDAKLYTKVKLSIAPENDEQIIVDLNKVRSYLANENLPLWTIEDGKLQKLNSKEIMENLGSFSMYQNGDKSSAAVYFHERFEFDGIIDIRYVIQGLYVNDDFVGEYDAKHALDHYAIIERKEWGHLDETLTINKKLVVPKYKSKWIGQNRQLNDKFKSVWVDHPTYFIETLLIVNYDITQQLMEYSHDDYTPLISYLLTLFNSVDMLFSKLDELKININIAGIIIGHERNSFPFLTKCYQSRKINRQTIEEIDAKCTDYYIASYLDSQRETIPTDSYDIVVFLTRYGLQVKNFDKNTGKIEMASLGGLTAYPSNGIYEYKKTYDKNTIVSTFMDDNDFIYFPNLAHEIAHAIGVSDHDEEPCDKKYGECNYKLMKQYAGFCKDCLDWSVETQNKMKKIFKSPDGYLFINRPRSLFPNSPQFMLTADEQCQYFGYKSALRLHRSMCKTLVDFCKTHLKCRSVDGEIHDTLLPMDGTPCTNHFIPNMVCWNRECVRTLRMG